MPSAFEVERALFRRRRIPRQRRRRARVNRTRPEVVHVQSLLDAVRRAAVALIRRRAPAVTMIHNVRTHERIRWDMDALAMLCRGRRCRRPHQDRGGDRAAAASADARVELIHHGDAGFLHGGAARPPRGAAALDLARRLDRARLRCDPPSRVFTASSPRCPSCGAATAARLVIAGPLLVGTEGEYREAIRRAGVDDAVLFRPGYVPPATSRPIRRRRRRGVQLPGHHGQRIAGWRGDLGTPVVATSVGSCEFLTDGVTARLVEPGHAGRWSRHSTTCSLAGARGAWRRRRARSRRRRGRGRRAPRPPRSSRDDRARWRVIPLAVAALAFGIRVLVAEFLQVIHPTVLSTDGREQFQATGSPFRSAVHSAVSICIARPAAASAIGRDGGPARLGLLFGALVILPAFRRSLARSSGVKPRCSWVFIAVHPRLVQNSASVLCEATYAFVLVSGVLAARRGLVGGPRALIPFAGLCFGLAYLVRPEGALYLVGLVVIVVFMIVTGRERAGTVLPWLGAAVLVFVVVVAPYVSGLAEVWGHSRSAARSITTCRCRRALPPRRRCRCACSRTCCSSRSTVPDLCRGSCSCSCCRACWRAAGRRDGWSRRGPARRGAAALRVARLPRRRASSPDPAVYSAFAAVGMLGRRDLDDVRRGWRWSPPGLSSRSSWSVDLPARPAPGRGRSATAGGALGRRDAAPRRGPARPHRCRVLQRASLGSAPAYRAGGIAGGRPTGARARVLDSREFSSIGRA